MIKQIFLITLVSCDLLKPFRRKEVKQAEKEREKREAELKEEALKQLNYLNIKTENLEPKIIDATYEGIVFSEEVIQNLNNLIQTFPNEKIKENTLEKEKIALKENIYTLGEYTKTQFIQKTSRINELSKNKEYNSKIESKLKAAAYLILKEDANLQKEYINILLDSFVYNEDKTVEELDKILYNKILGLPYTIHYHINELKKILLGDAIVESGVKNKEGQTIIQSSIVKPIFKEFKDELKLINVDFYKESHKFIFNKDEILVKFKDKYTTKEIFNFLLARISNILIKIKKEEILLSVRQNNLKDPFEGKHEESIKEDIIKLILIELGHLSVKS